MSASTFKKNINAQIKNALFTLPLLSRRISAPNLSKADLLPPLVGAVTDFCMDLYEPREGAFRFSPLSTVPDVYSTSYAISLLGLTGNLGALTLEDIDKIKAFLCRHQDSDGLFRDPVIASALAETGQGWGWQHLLPHTLIALDYLGDAPERDMAFVLEKFAYCTPDKWIDHIFSDDYLLASNHYMNAVIALQYSRDHFRNVRAGEIVSAIHSHTKKALLPGLIAKAQGAGRLTQSRVAKTIYHILPTMIFDNQLDLPTATQIAGDTAKTQNWLGGYGVSIVSDACEDIDSAYNLAICAQIGAPGCHRPLSKFLAYVCANQNKDGGFVFRRFLPFRYGDSDVLYSPRNASNMFATWFRTLSIAFADQAVSGGSYPWRFSRVPGYQFLPREDTRAAL